MDEKMVEEKILDMLEDLSGDPVVKEDRDIDLVGEGLIDSLDYVTLLVDIRDEFGLVLSPSELTREEMKSPNCIINVVESRLRG